jgi:uncharacterized membrane protein YqgA involved in biofilm formation
MIGTFLNVAGILVGSIVGLVRRKPLSPASDSFFKVALGVFTVFYGLRLTWLGVVNGPFLHVLKQLLIAILALMVGKLAGQLLRLQKVSNGLGRAARQNISDARPGDPYGPGAGFKTCAALFCASPLGLIGAVQDGTSGYYSPLAVKAVMDGLAALGFVSLFGWGVMLAALPVLAVQGTLSLLCLQFAKPFLEHAQLMDSVNAAGGLLVFSVALVILGLKKVALADYLPSLLFAPLITALWR